MSTIVTERTHGSIKFVKFNFTDNVTTTAAEALTAAAYEGKVLHVITAPSATKVPSANWDLTVLDNNGIDILAGAGINRSSGSTQHLLSSTLGALAGTKFRFVVANAGGTTGQGSVYAYIR